MYNIRLQKENCSRWTMRIGVQLQKWIVSTFGLRLRLYVIDHHTTFSAAFQRFTKKSIGVGWGKFYEHGVEAGPCGKRGKGHLLTFVVCRFSACLRADVSYFLCCTWKRKKRFKKKKQKKRYWITFVLPHVLYQEVKEEYHQRGLCSLRACYMEWGTPV